MFYSEESIHSFRGSAAMMIRRCERVGRDSYVSSKFKIDLDNEDQV